MTEQKSAFSFFLDLKIPFKWLLITSMVGLSIILVLGVLFAERLAQPRLEQIQQMGKAQTILVAGLAKNALASRDEQPLQQQLQELEEEIASHGGGFFEASVILHPAGVYLASTTAEYVGKTAHSSLLSRLGPAVGAQPMTQVRYRVGSEDIQAYQFLQTVTLEAGGQSTKAATVQIVLGYGDTVKEVQRRVIFAGFWILGGVLLLLWIFSMPLVTGMARVTDALDEVLHRRYQTRFEPEANDELGHLMLAMNQVTASSQTLHDEAQRLAAKVVEQEPSSPASALDGATLRKADLTCLCARLPGVQTVIHSEAPENIVTFVEAFLNSFSKKIADNGGQVVKILGDKVFCLFEGINGINNALRAAIHVNQTWREINRERRVMEKDPLEYGLGLHSAEGIAGNIGQGAGAYTFIGDAAKIAGYLCSCAKPGEILATSSMLERANHTYRHNVVEELKTYFPADKEEVFSIIEAMPFGDEETLKQRKPVQETAIFEPMQTTGVGLANERGIPDMLEETLSSAPLELNFADEAYHDLDDQEPA